MYVLVCMIDCVEKKKKFENVERKRESVGVCFMKKKESKSSTHGSNRPTPNPARFHFDLGLGFSYLLILLAAYLSC